MLRLALVFALLAGSAHAQALKIVQWDLFAYDQDDPEHAARVEAVISEIDSDMVVAHVPGIEDATTLREVLLDAGYPQVTLGSGITLIASKVPVDAVEFHTDKELSGDDFANDLSRPIVEVTLTHKGEPLTVIGWRPHSSSGVPARFRRVVEFRRLRQAVDLVEGALVLVIEVGEDRGRFPNLQPEVFTEPPPSEDLPSTYRLGEDIVFPIDHETIDQLPGALILTAATGRSHIFARGLKTSNATVHLGTAGPSTFQPMSVEVSPTSRCDVTQDGSVGVVDILAVNAAIFNPASCE